MSEPIFMSGWKTLTDKEVAELNRISARLLGQIKSGEVSMSEAERMCEGTPLWATRFVATLIGTWGWERALSDGEPRWVQTGEHGTTRAYRRELKAGIPTCGRCRAANAAAARKYHRRLFGEPTTGGHGTVAGYIRHGRDGTLADADACGCREANTRYARERRQGKLRVVKRMRVCGVRDE